MGPDRKKVVNGHTVTEYYWAGQSYARHRIAGQAELVEALEGFRAAMLSHGEWDDGCFYYNGTSASELQRPIELADAALRTSAVSEGEGK